MCIAAVIILLGKVKAMKSWNYFIFNNLIVNTVVIHYMEKDDHWYLQLTSEFFFPNRGRKSKLTTHLWGGRGRMIKLGYFFKIKACFKRNFIMPCSPFHIQTLEPGLKSWIFRAPAF